ncbi:pirin family protein [Leptospira sp. GIMC2001]|nr:pirin family protein [Leptospira sp. GIMC2001]WCL51287.1 pirin family protein [Leptospira sp. GIMC2001]
MKINSIQGIAKLGFQWPTSDPFLFCVHHEDYYPKGNANFGPNASLAGRDLGQDFAGKDGWRMYHGDKVPGFPGHPHRGFETVTVVQRGLVDHADSQGASGRYGDGDVQWMTAGSGIQHSEMFPLLQSESENTLELFQIWMNLPSKSKFVDPHFSMLWKEKIPVLEIKDQNNNKTKIKLISGVFQNMNSLNPPPNSWAADPKNEVVIAIIEMESNAIFNLDKASPGINRNLYFFQGKDIKIDDQDIPEYHRITLQSDADVKIENGKTTSKFLLLQGRPIAEPVAQYGPFVMNTREEIEQAFNDYRKTEFGGWPWPTHEPVHSQNKGRFAKYADGKEEFPVS